MSQNKRKSKGRRINPTFFVFCEGETEEQYICFLRTKYRLPIIIDAKIAGNRITEKYINNYKVSKVTDPKDKTFLVYDLDVPEMLIKLISIPNTVLLSSNPCFEFWYLLHYQEQISPLDSDECNSKLSNHHKKYKKGIFDNHLKVKINEKQEKAVHRAQKLVKHENPSSQVFELILELERAKMINNS